MVKLVNISKFCITLLLLLVFSISVSAETMVQFEYPYDNSVLMTIRNNSAEVNEISIMIGGNNSQIELPLTVGYYTYSISRIEDYAVGQIGELDIKDSEKQIIRLDPIELSLLYKLEITRSEFLRASTVEDTIKIRRQRSNNVGWLSVGGAVLAGIGAGVLYMHGQDLYKDYSAATVTQNATDLRSEIELTSGITIGLAAVVGTGLITAIISRIATPSIKDARRLRIDREQALALAEEGQASWPGFLKEDAARLGWEVEK